MSTRIDKDTIIEFAHDLIEYVEMTEEQQPAHHERWVSAPWPRRAGARLWWWLFKKLLQTWPRHDVEIQP